MHPLDHPFHASLAGAHRAFAIAAGGLLRYPADVAPFLGAATPDAATPDALAKGLALHVSGDALALWVQADATRLPAVLRQGIIIE